MRRIACILLILFGVASLGSGQAARADHETVIIWSQGVRLAGDLYKPQDLAAGTKLPGILLVHGWGGTKDHLGTAYARQFAELGFIVLAFDYKGWGESDGPLLPADALPETETSAEITAAATHVRQVVDPISMQADVRAALNYLAGEPQVMPERLGIWGTGLGAGVALITVIEDDRIKAFVDQIGSVNFKANMAPMTIAQLRQLETARARGQLPAYPGPESALPGTEGYPDWASFKRLDPFADLDQVTIPTLIIDVENETRFDRQVNGAALYAALKDRVPSDYLVIPGSFLDVYEGDGYRRALQAAGDWFRDHLKEDAAAASLYKTHCASCHSSSTVRAPALSALKAMSRDKLIFSMTDGKMAQYAADLSDRERRDLAAYLATRSDDPRGWERAMACPADVIATTDAEPTVAGWGYGTRNHRYQPADRAGLGAEQLPDLELAWAQAFPGATEMRSQPVIVGTTLYVGVEERRAVFAIDLPSGCLLWSHVGDGPLRSALGFGRMPDDGRPFVYYGDFTGAVYAVDAADGSRIWQSDVKIAETTMVTGSPVLHGERLYVPLSSFEIALAGEPSYECCKTHGGVSALDVRTGEIVWTYHTTADAAKTSVSSAGTQLWGPAGAPVWTTPAIDPALNRLYVGTGQNYSHPVTGTSDAIIALDLETGEPAWVFQALADDAYNAACTSWLGTPDGPNCPEDYGPDFDFGASVIIASASDGNDILLAGQKSGDVWALDPGSGAVVWHNRVSDGTPFGGVHWGMTAVGDRLFVPIADPEWDITRWPYEPKVGIVALDVTTGEATWRHHASRGCEPSSAEPGADGLPGETWPACPHLYGYSGAAVGLDDVVFAARLDGKVTAFAPSDGRVLWEYDTKRPYDTLNGVEGHGGSLDNSGWLVVGGGWLVVQSGYGLFNQMPGNVLLVFRVASPEEED